MEPINNIRWLETFRPDKPKCPKAAVFVIIVVAVTAWALVAAVVLSLV
jgi:hypothetical protein